MTIMSQVQWQQHGHQGNAVDVGGKIQLAVHYKNIIKYLNELIFLKNKTIIDPFTQRLGTNTLSFHK